MKEEVKIGKDYIMADRFWTPVEIDEGNQIAIMQSLGVTKGPWPGYSMPQFGNNKYYGSDINHLDDEIVHAQTPSRHSRPVIA